MIKGAVAVCFETKLRPARDYPAVARDAGSPPLAFCALGFQTGIQGRACEALSRRRPVWRVLLLHLSIVCETLSVQLRLLFFGAPFWRTSFPSCVSDP